MNKLSLAKPIFFLFLISSTSISQTYWVKYGWQVFENAGDARSQSLGSAVISDQGGTISSLYNPALVSMNIKQSVHYTHQSRLGGMINSDLFGIPLKNFKRPFNIILLHESIDRIPDTRDMLLDFGLDGIPGTGDVGEGNGQVDEGERLDRDKLSYFSQKQTGVHLSTSWKMKSYSYGLAIKSLFHNIGEFSSTGVGIDVGLISDLWANGKLGLLAKDITTSWQVWNNGTIERFKPVFIAGISHQHSLNDLRLKLIGSIDLKWDTNGSKAILKTFDTNNTFLMLGMNIKYNDRIALRFGQNQIKSTTIGIGLNWSNISLDYAFINQPINSGLGSTHLISLNFDSKLILDYIDRL